MSLIKKAFLYICMSVTYAFMGTVQAGAEQLSQQEITDTIRSINAVLESKYVFPDQAKKISKHLNKKHRKGAYNKLKNSMLFAEQIQQDIHTVVNDSHLIFVYNPEHADSLMKKQDEQSESWDIQTQSDGMERFNYGFQSVQILNGNIGYLKLDGFYDTEHAAETAVAAMNYLSRSDAIIFDLRQNDGGSWEMVQLISSYLFHPAPVHLGGFYWRPEDQHTQHWTLPHVPGRRNPEAEVLILTSASTHSAAEEFAYNLKHLKRATVIGETTAGGAHPGGFVAVNNRFVLFVPLGRSVNPITQTNWEGVGVIPHRQVPASDALDVAKLRALEKLAAKHPDERGDLYRWFLISEKAKANPVKLSQETLKTYAGTYGPRKLLVAGDEIFYQRANGPKLLLNPLQKDMFELAVDNSFRIKIISENGVVTAMQGLFDNGYKDQFSKEQ